MTQIESELSNICDEILKLLDTKLIPSTTTGNSKVFYLKHQHKERETREVKERESRDDNLYPTRKYPARPDPNGSDFTRPDKL